MRNALGIVAFLLIVLLVGSCSIILLNGGGTYEGDSGQVAEPTSEQEETTEAGPLQYNTVQEEEEVELPDTGGYEIQGQQ